MMMIVIVIVIIVAVKLVTIDDYDCGSWENKNKCVFLYLSLFSSSYVSISQQFSSALTRDEAPPLSLVTILRLTRCLLLGPMCI